MEESHWKIYGNDDYNPKYRIPTEGVALVRLIMYKESDNSATINYDDNDSAFCSRILNGCSGSVYLGLTQHIKFTIDEMLENEPGEPNYDRLTQLLNEELFG